MARCQTHSVSGRAKAKRYAWISLLWWRKRVKCSRSEYLDNLVSVFQHNLILPYYIIYLVSYGASTVVLCCVHTCIWSQKFFFFSALAYVYNLRHLYIYQEWVHNSTLIWSLPANALDNTQWKFSLCVSPIHWSVSMCKLGLEYMYPLHIVFTCTMSV
jgi:hypothetical protein